MLSCDDEDEDSFDDLYSNSFFDSDEFSSSSFQPDETLNAANSFISEDVAALATLGYELQYVCYLCDRTFSRIIQLRSHMRRHIADDRFEISRNADTGETSINMMKIERRGPRNNTEWYRKARAFRCSHCSKTFSHLHNLERHMTVHTGVKPFSCLKCGRRFTQTRY